MDEELLRLDLLGRRSDLGAGSERDREQGVERAVLAGLGRQCLVGHVVVDGAFHSHGLVQQHLGSLVRVVRVDDLHLGRTTTLPDNFVVEGLFDAGVTATVLGAKR